jgi:hypothetical protein
MEDDEKAAGRTTTSRDDRDGTTTNEEVCLTNKCFNDTTNMNSNCTDVVSLTSDRRKSTFSFLPAVLPVVVGVLVE